MEKRFWNWLSDSPNHPTIVQLIMQMGHFFRNWSLLGLLKSGTVISLRLFFFFYIDHSHILAVRLQLHRQRFTARNRVSITSLQNSSSSSGKEFFLQVLRHVLSLRIWRLTTRVSSYFSVVPGFFLFCYGFSCVFRHFSGCVTKIWIPV